MSALDRISVEERDGKCLVYLGLGSYPLTLTPERAAALHRALSPWCKGDCDCERGGRLWCSENGHPDTK